MGKKLVPLGASLATLKKRGWNTFDPQKRPKSISQHGMKRLVFNRDYLVREFERKTEWGYITLLSIRRNDGAPIHDWKEFWRIKNQLSGRHRVAIEIYPGEADLVETPYTYYLWILPEDFQLPFGLNMREQ